MADHTYHLTDAELKALLDTGPGMFTPYRHSRTGRLYFVVVCAIRESDQELMVVYRGVESGLTWCRPLAEFLGPVEVEGRAVPRFVRVVRTDDEIDTH